MISTDERTLSFGVNSFGVIANDDRLYLVVLAGSFFFLPEQRGFRFIISNRLVHALVPLSSQGRNLITITILNKSFNLA
jgi:hypothetical protein